MNIRVGEKILHGHPETLGDFFGVVTNIEGNRPEPADEVDIRFAVPVPMPMAQTDHRFENRVDAGFLFNFPDHRVCDMLSFVEGPARELEPAAGKHFIPFRYYQETPIIQDHPSGADVMGREGRNMRVRYEGEGQLKLFIHCMMKGKPGLDRRRNKSGQVFRDGEPYHFYSLFLPYGNAVTEMGGKNSGVRGKVGRGNDETPKGVRLGF
jgi:hypothetical protein